MVVVLRISTRGRYGMNAVYELAKAYESDPVSLKQISTLRNIPLPYLEQLIMQLRKAGIVHSIRGAKGGYILNRAPQDIYVLEVLEVLEGEVVPVQCKDEDSCNCCDGNICPGEIVWERVHNAVIEATKDYSLAELVQAYKAIEA